MVTSIHQIRSMNDLRDYVNMTLCQRYELQLDAFRLTERRLVRGGQPCGMYYCLHGPRQVKFTAIWETERNQILFYDSGGERFQTTQLLSAPCPEPIAA